MRLIRSDSREALGRLHEIVSQGEKVEMKRSNNNSEIELD